MHDRRRFLKTVSLGYVGLAVMGGGVLTGLPGFAAEAGGGGFDALTWDRQSIAIDVSKFDLRYSFDTARATITAKSSYGSVSKAGAALVIPVLSPSGEKVLHVSANRIEITKPGGTVVVEATVPLTIHPNKKGRVFNMVPGCEAVPIIAHLPKIEGMKAVCTIYVK